MALLQNNKDLSLTIREQKKNNNKKTVVLKIKISIFIIHHTKLYLHDHKGITLFQKLLHTIKFTNHDCHKLVKVQSLKSWIIKHFGKLPTYPSPKPTFCPKSEVSGYVGLGDGQVGSFRNLSLPSLLSRHQTVCMRQGF